MVFLLQLLLSLQQCVHAVVAAADLLIVLFLQHGGYTAQAADAASPGTHPTAAASCWRRCGLTGASRYTQGLTCPVNQLLCEQTKGKHFTAMTHVWKNFNNKQQICDFFLLVSFVHTYGPKVREQIPCTSYTWWIHRGDSGAVCSGCWTCFHSQDRTGHLSHSPTTLQTSQWLNEWRTDINL